MDDLLNILNSLSHVTNFDKICIGLASPEKIRSWSYGEIKTSETINYRTFKPEHDGLFCAKIFGTVKNYECLCGKYKLFKHQGIVCEKCGVEVTRTSVRRERMGHIELAAPVAHIWYLKSLPSRIGLLLDMPLRDLERILYFEAYVVIDPYETSLKRGQLLSESSYLEAIEEYGNEFDARMGGDAVYELLRQFDLINEEKQLHNKIKNSQSETLKKKFKKRISLMQNFLRSGNKPEWMILKTLPVLPPDLRPLVQFEGGERFISSDLNELYRRVINRNNRTKRLLKLKAPDVVIRNELRMLQESVDALIDNGKQHKTFTGANKLPLQSLSDLIKGKQGRFRQNLLGKRVDYSGRSVIIVNPSLELHQCGLPKEMALELFKPFLLNQLEKSGLAISIYAAKQLVEERSSDIWAVLEEVVQSHPVLLNRTPTLYHLGIQAFEPILVDGKAIQLHPLISQAFDASFDGDQMTVHIPLSIEAQLEARVVMSSENNILSPANGKPLIAPSQEMVLGLYWMTSERAGVLGEGMVFVDIDEVQRAYENGVVDLQASIKVRIRNKRIKTTVGRAILLQKLPEYLPFELINICLRKQNIIQLVDTFYRRFGLKASIIIANKLMSIGLQFATKAGISVSIDTMVIPVEKPSIINAAINSINAIQEQQQNGLISQIQCDKQIVDIWIKTKDKVDKTLLMNLSNQDNTLYMMIDSGVRSILEIAQLSGMTGLMSKQNGGEIAITANFREGLKIPQYFPATHNARKSLADSSLKTANAGYLTRRLVDVAQDVIINEVDCGTTKGLIITALIKENKILASLNERILGRVLSEDIFEPKQKKLLIKAGTLLDEEKVKQFEKLGINNVKVRSPITCESKQGICAMCYGRNLANGQLINIGDAIGVIAAQSIGQSGTQLTLRTHNSNGIPQKTATINSIKINSKGTIKYHNIKLIQKPTKKSKTKQLSNSIVISHSGELSLIDELGIERERYNIPYGAKLFVNDNEPVQIGQQIASWQAHTVPIITEFTGYISFVDIPEVITLSPAGEKIKLIIKDYKQWPIHAKQMHPRLKLVDKNNKPIKFNGSKQSVTYFLPPYAIINVEEGKKVNIGDIIATIPQDLSENLTNSLFHVIELFEARSPKEQAILAHCSGTISFYKETKTKRRFIISNNNGKVDEFSISKKRAINISTGQKVEQGEIIVEGTPNIHDILRLKGVNELVKLLINELQEIYINHNVIINDKHFEVIIGQMLRTVSIVSPGDTSFLVGDIVMYKHLLEANREITKNSSGKIATWEPKLLGITKASLATESFISAASFMDTTRVLLASAIKGKSDELHGIKENVIIGRLIPAGTGLPSHHRSK
jgi:DNA-directed RNA polymerase subunit beta'